MVYCESKTTGGHHSIKWQQLGKLEEIFPIWKWSYSEIRTSEAENARGCHFICNIFIVYRVIDSDGVRENTP